MGKSNDFIISYARQDLPWATWIAQTLEAAGYTTIIQAWDFNVGDNFIDKMDTSLKESERFLAVLSAKYLNSPYCKVESAAAYFKDINLEKAAFVPVRIEDVTTSGIFTDVAYIDLLGLDEETATKSLLEGVFHSGAVNKPGQAGTKRTKYPGDMPLNNLPYTRNPYFTGRNDKLELTHSNFLSGDRVSFTQSVTGLGGVGKTSIALEYAYRYSHEYETIWWVNADTYANALISYRNFAIQKRIVTEEAKSEEIIDTVKHWFNNNENWLFVFDNADSDDFNKWLESYLPQSSKGHVLVTTRSNHFPRSKSIDIIIFNEDEAVTFLNERTGKIGDGYSDDLAKKLAECLQYLPLALEQAAAYIMETTGVTYQDYISLLDERGVETFEKDNYLVDYTSIINVTWNISMQKITNESARQMFNMCAYFAPDQIPVDMFVRGGEVLPEPLKDGIADLRERNAILRDLTRYSLMTWGRIDNISSDEKRVLNVHRLVQKVVKKSFEENHEWLIEGLNLCNSLAEWNLYSVHSIQAFKTDAVHIECVAAISHQLLSHDGDKLRSIASIYHSLVLMHSESFNVDAAIKCSDKLILLMERFCLDSDSFESRFNLFISYLNRGQLITKIRDYKKALEYSDKSISLGEQLLSESELFDENELASAYMNRGIVYEYMSLYDKALTDKNKSIAIYERLYANGKLKDRNKLALAYMNRGATYSSMELYIESSEDNKRCISIWSSMKYEGLHIDESSLAKAYLNISINATKQTRAKYEIQIDKRAQNSILKGVMASHKRSQKK